MTVNVVIFTVTTNDQCQFSPPFLECFFSSSTLLHSDFALCAKNTRRNAGSFLKLETNLKAGLYGRKRGGAKGHTVGSKWRASSGMEKVFFKVKKGTHEELSTHPCVCAEVQCAPTSSEPAGSEVLCPEVSTNDVMCNPNKLKHCCPLKKSSFRLCI